jgi:hypothetical protein
LRSAAVAAVAMLLAGCAAFTDHPPAEDRAAVKEVAPLGGVVRLDATFELRRDGKIVNTGGWFKDNLVAVEEAYETSGVFDRVGDVRERPTTVAIVRARGLVESNPGWRLATFFTLFLVPSSTRVAYDVETTLIDPATQREIGRSSVCRSLRENRHLFMLPFAAVKAKSKVEQETVAAATQLGLALALGAADPSPVLAAAAADACPGSAQLARPRIETRDPRGSWEAVSASRVEGACLDRPGVRAYLNEVKAQVREHWTPVSSAPTLPPAALLLDFTPEGFVEAAEPEIAAGDPVIWQRTIEAVRAAMPFGPLEEHLACVADEPVPLRFTD